MTPEAIGTGDTLVVETTNIKGSFQLTSAAGPNLRIVERFTPSADGALEWSVTIDDPSAWTRPWTFSMPLARQDDSQGPLEYACHEGNHALRNMLSAARAEEKSAPPAQQWTVPRTADGQPDLEGVWNYATVTPLERPAEFKGRAFMTADEAMAFERRTLERSTPTGEPRRLPCVWGRSIDQRVLAGAWSAGEDRRAVSYLPRRRSA